jgi:hypothetical protein
MTAPTRRHVGLAAVATELSVQLASALKRIANQQHIAAVDLAEVWFVDRRGLLDAALIGAVVGQHCMHGSGGHGDPRRVRGGRRTCDGDGGGDENGATGRLSDSSTFIPGTIPNHSPELQNRESNGVG